MGSLKSALRLVVRLVAVAALLLFIHEPSSKLAAGQLEAVGALMSVVPVTSILATAGLVGVKLVALSRLLDVLGYDRAYLAQGGSGTAAQPIGLQTKYAYMFPYVPGLNISVQGDDSIGMPRESLDSKTGEAPARKTYPAMGLPGDYEKVQRPFRGSEALRGIFQQAGIQVHLPTAQQQQQLQQQFNLSPQGKDQSRFVAPTNYNQPQPQQQQQQIQQLQPQPQQQSINSQPPPNDSALDRGHDDAAQQASTPSSSSFHRVHQVPASHHQHQQKQQQQARPTAADAAAQVNMSAQSSLISNSNLNPNSSPPHGQTSLPAPLPPVALMTTPTGHLTHTQATPAPLERSPPPPPPPAEEPERVPASRTHWGSHAIIPQRDEFLRRFLASRSRHKPAPSRPQPPAAPEAPVVQMGHLSHPESPHQSLETSLPPPSQPQSQAQQQQQQQQPSIHAVEFIPNTGSQQPQPPPRPSHSHAHVHHNPSPPTSDRRHPQPASFSPGPPGSFGPAPDSTRPQQQKQQGGAPQPPPPHLFGWSPRPTPASLGNGFSAQPNEMTTNFLPNPFDLDDSPATLAHDDHNELDRTNQRSRRKRSPELSQQPALESLPPVGGGGGGGGPLRQALMGQPQAESSAQAASSSGSAQTFGMPALNIHALKRRRKRQAGGSLASRLRPVLK